MKSCGVPQKKDGKELNMAVSGNHFCYITNVSGFAKSFICTAK